VDRAFMASVRPSATTDMIRVPADFSNRPISGLITQSPPKNIRSKMYWIQQSVNLFRQLSISNSIETYGAFSFQLSDLSDSSTLTSLFDDYCIYSVAVSVAVNYSGSTGGTISGELCTAVDFDSAVTPSSFASLAQYATANISKVKPGLTVQRFIKPCNSPAMYGGSAFTSYGVGRYWVDCNSSGVPHYALKVAFTGNGLTGLSYDLIATYIVGFRNTI
jgi:hypothetical protein